MCCCQDGPASQSIGESEQEAAADNSVFRPLPRGMLLAGTQESRVTRDTGTQEERVVSKSTQLGRESPPKVRKGERQVRAAATASPGCSAPTVSTALEMSVWILKGDGGYSHRRKTGALHIRGMEDIQTGGWFKHIECLSASTCWPRASI